MPDERTIELNSLQMHVRARGSGPPVLLVHGFTGCGADWDLVFPPGTHGFRSIAPDLRGHGRSTNPSGAFTFRQAADDILALLDVLAIERTRAIGLSGGAQVLLHIATRHPDRIPAMVLVSTAPYFPAQARAIMSQFNFDAVPPEERQRLRTVHVRGDEQIRALYEQGRALKDSYDDVNFTPPLLSRIASPTLIVHGDRDPFYPVSLAVEMYSALPRASLWVMPNAGHAPIFNEQAQAFAAAALAFLAEPSAAGTA